MSSTSRHTRGPSLARHYRQSLVVTAEDAYSYALRAAYLHHLLQPRPRTRVEVPIRHPHRTSTNITELIRDFNPTASHGKSTKYPKELLGLLTKRLEDVVMGKEPGKEYQDGSVKRSFASFYNVFRERAFYKQMKESRKAEDLMLIFYSQATKDVQKNSVGKEESKWVVDMHLALFVRLMNSCLKSGGWSSSHSDLMKRLQELESRLLRHDQNLADGIPTGAGNRSSTPVLGPPAAPSYDVNDMPLVKVVASVFDLPLEMVQLDINKNKDVWTEGEALQDTKAYTYHLGLDTTRTLRREDFGSDEAYEIWNKREKQELTKIMLNIMSSNPTEMSKTTTSPINTRASVYFEHSRSLSMASTIHSVTSETESEYSFGMLGQVDEFDDVPYTFIPHDPRQCFRILMNKCMVRDMNEAEVQTEEGIKFFSKSSLDLMAECALRWRLHPTSRCTLMLDIVREHYRQGSLGLDHVDAAFEEFKETVEPEFENWPTADIQLHVRVLKDFHESILRELYEVMQTAYKKKHIPTGKVLYVLDTHIYADPLFEEPDTMDTYRKEISNSLAVNAENRYLELLSDLPREMHDIDVSHLLDLTKNLLSWSERINKRFPRPVLDSIDPVMILVESVYPKFAEDMKDLLPIFFSSVQEEGGEVHINDALQLYEELTQVRSAFLQAYPNDEFQCNLEEIFADFVWRFIRNTEQSVIGWVDEAIKQDNFILHEREDGRDLTDEERHSSSVVDVFRSFNQTSDVLKKLGWQDELMMARFMTAFAKCLVSGVMRYSEELERKFTQEMDRQTPEQEAASRQTGRERWLTLAKEAWSNKEKIEPFQFAPESCVKLNDIEFAINQLDKLEHAIDTDRWAAALAAHAASQPLNKRKQDASYVFTIKIVEAEDLKPMDMSGYSDPYVVLGDEYQKRLAKTRVIYANLNPRWEESVDITVKGPIWLTATVWDWDQMGAHDCVGRTSIKLDPAHFGDFLPREYWLDLDTQGRLLLRVSMEGERDDIEFYFGKAFRALKRAERDMTRQITDKLSAYIHHCLSRQALKGLLNRGISIASVSSLFSRTGFSSAKPAPVVPVSREEIAAALAPLIDYFNDNFSILAQTLTRSALIMVMSRLWKEVLVTLELLLVPTLSDKPSQQKPLSSQEVDIVKEWLTIMYDFFHAKDEVTGEVTGVPAEILRSPKYHELQSIHFFYFDSTESLIRTSERIANSQAARQQNASRNLLAPSSAGNSLSPQTVGRLGIGSSVKRTKSVLNNRNLGTMRKVKAERRREAQEAEPNDDMILRILRMRPEAAKYLRDRSKQKERLAAAAAADLIVRQSMGNSVRPGDVGRGFQGVNVRRSQIALQ